jgi:hypothetical protein
MREQRESATTEIGSQFATQAFATANSPKALLTFDLTDQDGTGPASRV